MGYKRAQERNRRLKKLYKETHKVFGSGGAYYDEDKQRYIKYSYSGRSKYLRTCGNRRFRRIRNEEASLSPADYKRYYDYWWNLL